jgi:hypothetical protein
LPNLNKICKDNFEGKIRKKISEKIGKNLGQSSNDIRAIEKMLGDVTFDQKTLSLTLFLLARPSFLGGATILRIATRTIMTLRIMTFIIMTPSIMGLFTALSIYNTNHIQHSAYTTLSIYNTQHIQHSAYTTLSIITLLISTF